MPRGDKSGPFAEGPGTGRGMGYCTGNDHPGYASLQSGRGLGRRFQGGAGTGRGAGLGYGAGTGRGAGFRAGRGYGAGRGFGDYYQGGVEYVSEKTLIENEIRILKDQLSALEGRLSGKEEK